MSNQNKSLSTKKNKPNQFSIIEKIITTVAQSRKVKTLSREEALQVVQRAYFKAIIARGATVPNKEDLQAEILILTDAILRERKGLTTGELELALENGALGLYGKVYGVNPNSAMEWITTYSNSHERKQALKHFTNEEEKTKQRKELSRLEANNFWEERKRVYQSKGSCAGTDLLFKYLTKLNKANTNDKTVQELAVKRARLIRSKRKADINNLQALRDIMSRYDDESSAGFRHLARMAAVYNQFDKELSQ